MAVSEAQIEQHPLDLDLAGRRPVATLRVPPDGLAPEAAIEWREGHDELDAYRAAAVSTGPDDPIFVLIAYAGAPHETVVLGTPSPDLDGHLDRLFTALGVTPANVIDRIVHTAAPAEAIELMAEAETLRRAMADLDARFEMAVVAYRDAAARDLRNYLAHHADLADPAVQRAMLEIVAKGRVAELSARERQVLALLGEGRSAREISDHLALSPSTVSRVRARLRKLFAE